MNHSCAPSTILDTTRMLVFAANDLAAGDELTFFYPSTEWEMSSPFICLCGAPNCIHVVAGARFLPLSTLEDHFLNQHIRELMIDLLKSYRKGTSATCKRKTRARRGQSTIQPLRNASRTAWVRLAYAQLGVDGSHVELDGVLADAQRQKTRYVCSQVPSRRPKHFRLTLRQRPARAMLLRRRSHERGGAGDQTGREGHAPRHTATADDIQRQYPPTGSARARVGYQAGSSLGVIRRRQRRHGACGPGSEAQRPQRW